MGPFMNILLGGKRLVGLLESRYDNLHTVAEHCQD